MDLQKFLESGLLELYLLDQCSSTERILVEKMIQQYAEVREEKDQIEHTLERVGQSAFLVPPPHLKSRILDAIKNTPPDPSPEVSKEVNLPPTNGSKGLLLALTAGLLLAGSYLFYQNNALKTQNQNLEAALTTQQQQLDDCTQKRAQNQQNYALLRDSNTTIVRLQKAQNTALVYHNPALGQTILDLSGLTAPPAGKYYQFWAIVNNVPQSMGMVSQQLSSGWQALPFVPGATNFAISIEDVPEGRLQPSNVEMIKVIGAG